MAVLQWLIHTIYCPTFDNIHYFFTSLISYFSSQWGPKSGNIIVFSILSSLQPCELSSAKSVQLVQSHPLSFHSRFEDSNLGPQILDQNSNHYTSLAFVGWLVLNSRKQPVLSHPIIPQTSFLFFGGGVVKGDLNFLFLPAKKLAESSLLFPDFPLLCWRHKGKMGGTDSKLRSLMYSGT